MGGKLKLNSQDEDCQVEQRLALQKAKHRLLQKADKEYQENVCHTLERIQFSNEFGLVSPRNQEFLESQVVASLGKALKLYHCAYLLEQRILEQAVGQERRQEKRPIPTRDYPEILMKLNMQQKLLQAKQLLVTLESEFSKAIVSNTFLAKFNSSKKSFTADHLVLSKKDNPKAKSNKTGSILKA